MAKKNWKKAADEEFAHLPMDYKEDWAELREIILHDR
jgi:hypothetical protein